MSTLQIIVNSILTVLLPALIGLAIILERTLAQRLPDHQAPRLIEFAKMAVQNVEFQNGAASNKTELAASFVELLFKEWHLPVPSKDTIAVAVGSAFYEVSKGQ